MTGAAGGNVLHTATALRIQTTCLGFVDGGRAD